jgi:major inositol transporter-like SP family MFS transporter
VTNTLISLVFPTLVAVFGSDTFLLVAFTGCLTLMFIGVAVPETKGRSLESLEEHFREQYASF